MSLFLTSKNRNEKPYSNSRMCKNMSLFLTLNLKKTPSNSQIYLKLAYFNSQFKKVIITNSF